MKVKLKGKFKFILIGLAIAIILASAVVIVNNVYTEIRYQFVKYLLLTDYISYNGNYYAFHGSESDVDEGMIWYGDEVRVTLVDKHGKPYKEGRSERAHLYKNDPDAKYIYFDGGSWKKIDMVK